MPDAEIPQRGDIYVSRSNVNVKVVIVGRSQDQVVVEPWGDSTFIEGRKAFSLHAFRLAFRLLISFQNRENDS